METFTTEFTSPPRNPCSNYGGGGSFLPKVGELRCSFLWLLTWLEVGRVIASAARTFVFPVFLFVFCSSKNGAACGEVRKKGKTPKDPTELSLVGVREEGCFCARLASGSWENNGGQA